MPQKPMVRAKQKRRRAKKLALWVQAQEQLQAAAPAADKKAAK
jgi:hypothetical protein